MTPTQPQAVRELLLQRAGHVIATTTTWLPPDPERHSMDKKTAWQTLRAYAEGSIHHTNAGSCPDGIEGHVARDNDCPVCQALEATQHLQHIGEPAVSAPVLDDRWKTRVLDGRAIERDAKGFGEHPDLPALGEGMHQLKFFESLGLQLTGHCAQDELDMDAYDTMSGTRDLEVYDFNGWTPSHPDGEGWCLVSIHDTDDGPMAWWLRAITAEVTPAAVACSVGDRRAFIRGWDERGKLHGLQGSVESDSAMRVLMDVYFPMAAPALEAPAAPVPAARKVFLVATGETSDGAETYTRHDDAPPPMCEAECLYTAPAAAPQAPAAPSGMVHVLPTVIRKLIQELNKASPGNDTAAKAEDYLKLHALRMQALAAATAATGELSQAERDVLAERRRQVSAEGFSHARDDQYVGRQLAGAATSYLILAAGGREDEARTYWPWRQEWLKPGSQRRYLEKACALGLAEMERLDRAAIQIGANSHD